MWAAAEGHSRLGIPQSVGKEFVEHDSAAPAAAGDLSDFEAAEAVRDRDLPSPTRYGDFALFALRITGTGAAYRDAIGEYAFRDPSTWLSKEFVERCNGLPVVFEHPERSGLDAKEFSERIIGTIVLPYREGDEVWGIAKIYDASAIDLMQTTHRSTSPGVVPQRDSRAIDLDDGKRVLDETLPLVLDHLAICAEGVWDKTGPPLGVRLDQSEKGKIMNEDELRKERDDAVRRADAAESELREMKAQHDTGREEREIESDIDAKEREREGEAQARKRSDAKADDIRDIEGEIDDKRLSEMTDEEFAAYERGDAKRRSDALRARRDARRDESKSDDERESERAEREAEKYGRDESEAEKRAVAAADREDGRRKDARKDEAKVEDVDADQIEKLKDSMRNDSAKIRSLQRQIDALSKPQSFDDRNEIARAFHRADALMQKLGENAPMALPGESPIAYRRRLANGLRKFSPAFKEYALHDATGASFDHIEDVIYRDAEAASKSPSVVSSVAGGLREVVTTAHGKTKVEFFGDARAAWQPFMPPVQNFITKFCKPSQNQNV